MPSHEEKLRLTHNARMGRRLSLQYVDELEEEIFQLTRKIRSQAVDLRFLVAACAVQGGLLGVIVWHYLHAWLLQ